MKSARDVGGEYLGSWVGRPEGNSAPHGVAMTPTNPTWSEANGPDQSLFQAEPFRGRSGMVRSAEGLSRSSAGSVEKLERIIAELLPADIATDLMTRRGTEAKQRWESLTTTPLYEALTVWVMAAWPDEMVERVDTMVRTAIASADRVRQGHWSTEHFIAVVRKAGQRRERREVHRHLGQEVRIVSFDDALTELAEVAPAPSTHSSSLGHAIVVAPLRSPGRAQLHGDTGRRGAP